MSEPDNTKNWDDFSDKFSIELFKNEGIAQLGRKYIKNGYYIYHHIPFDEFDKITPIPIVAKGIAAFLASDDYMLREAVRGKGRNAGKGVHGFYQSYYDDCMKSMRHNEKCRAIFESGRKSDYELIQEHLKSEIVNLKESELLFAEFHVFGVDSEGSEYKELERSFIAIVKRAAEEYPKWVKENKMPIEASRKSVVPKLTIDQIALKYVFEEGYISKENASQIAKENGHSSGEKLYQRFIFYRDNNDRKARPTNNTKITSRNKIKLFESVIALLPESKKNRAIDELNILKCFYKSDHQ